MIEQEVSNYIDRSILCWLATANAKGEPNVSPKEIFCLYKDFLLIANIASPQSAKNIKKNKSVCISFVDVLEQKGFQLKGEAIILGKDSKEYEVLSTPLLVLSKNMYPFDTIFKIKVTSAKPIIAPSYFHYPSESREEKIEKAKRLYLLN